MSALPISLSRSKWQGMTLDDYLRADGSKTLTALSKEIGVSKGRLSQLRKEKHCPPELALRLEAATGGALNASNLSPIVFDARRSAA